jgi:hypothetical protein
MLKEVSRSNDTAAPTNLDHITIGNGDIMPTLQLQLTEIVAAHHHKAAALA